MYDPKTFFISIVKGLKMTTEVLIHGSLRDDLGSGAARSLRRQNMTPGVIYGKNQEAIHVSLPSKEINALANTFEFKTKAINIVLGDKKYKVLPKEANLHPVTDKVEHVDFLSLNDKETIRVNVPLYFSNQDKSVGIKRGGALNAVFRNIKVSAVSSSIPEYIEVSLEDTVVGDVIRFADIKFPEGVTPVEKNMQITVAKIVGKKSLQIEEDKPEGAEGEASEGAAKKEESSK